MQRLQYRFKGWWTYGLRQGCLNTYTRKKMLDKITQLKAADKSSLVITLDIKNAFNNVWWPAVLAGLGKQDCPENIYKLTKSFFWDRGISYVKNGINRQKATTEDGSRVQIQVPPLLGHFQEFCSVRFSLE